MVTQKDLSEAAESIMHDASSWGIDLDELERSESTEFPSRVASGGWYTGRTTLFVCSDVCGERKRRVSGREEGSAVPVITRVKLELFSSFRG
jgi:hypothetical protein